MIIPPIQNQILTRKSASLVNAVSAYFNPLRIHETFKLILNLAWSEWEKVNNTDIQTVQASKRSNGEKVEYKCGVCENLKTRKCPSTRKEDCGENDKHSKNCETLPCPMWSSWNNKRAKNDREYTCLKKTTRQKHFCNENISDKGFRIKYRDCQGEA